MSGFDWSPYSDDDLRDLAAKHSATQIGSIIGATRNAVIGRLSRRGIRLAKGLPADELKRVREKRAEKLAAAAPAPVVPEPSFPIVTLVDPMVDFDIAKEHPRRKAGVHFMDAREGQCRWPLWKDRAPFSAKFFCGEPVLPKQSYCQHCYSLGFNPRYTADIDRQLGIPRKRRAA